MRKIILLSIIFLASCGITQQSEVERFHSDFSKKDSGGNFEILWSKSLINSDFRESSDMEMTQPILSNNKTLYIGASNGVFGEVTLDKGVFVWKKQLKAPITGEIHLTKNGELIYLGNDNSIYKTTASGDVVWKTQLDNERVISKIVELDNTIYFKSSKERVYSINIDNGERWWVTKSYMPDWFKIESNSSIVVNNFKIFSTFSDGTFAIFDRKSGKSIFETKFSSGEGFQDFGGELTLIDEKLLIPSFKGGVIAFDINKNIEIWQQKEVAFSSVIVWKGFGFYISENSLLKISLNDGKVIEKIKLNINNITNILEFNNNLMLFSKNEGLFVIDLLGKKSSKHLQLSSGVSGIPIIFDNQLIFIANSGILYSVKLHH